MSTVTVYRLDKDRARIDTKTGVCYAGMSQWIREDKVQYLAFRWTRTPIDSDAKEALFALIKTMWDMPVILDGMETKDYNKGCVPMDVDKWSLWHIFNHFALLRYLDDEEHPDFAKRFYFLRRNLPQFITDVQVFVIANLCGNMVWNSNHMFYTHHLKVGPLEHLKTAEDLRTFWPTKMDSARKQSDYGDYLQSIIKAKWPKDEIVVHRYEGWSGTHHMPMIIAAKDKAIYPMQLGRLFNKGWQQILFPSYVSELKGFQDERMF